MFDQRNTRAWCASAAAAVSLSVFCLTGCGSGGGGNDSAQATPQGTIDLHQVKVGMPESTFEKAVVTFVPDPKGAMGTKTQYLSRTPDENGAQYVVQCTNGRSYEIQVYFHQTPVSKDVAMKALENLLPSEAIAAPAIDAAEVKAGQVPHPMEVLQYGKDYKGQIAYADNKADSVILVNAWCLPAAGSL
jgi:hypothetical protein